MKIDSRPLTAMHDRCVFLIDDGHMRFSYCATSLEDIYTSSSCGATWREIHGGPSGSLYRCFSLETLGLGGETFEAALMGPSGVFSC